eukprot:SAG11_NODE_7358_length_1156_cov_1.461684_2_plen_120_part_00
MLRHTVFDTRCIPQEAHSAWLEFNGDSRRFKSGGPQQRLLTITSTGGRRLPAPGLTATTRNGKYIATCVGSAIEVTQWEWYHQSEVNTALKPHPLPYVLQLLLSKCDCVAYDRAARPLS